MDYCAYVNTAEEKQECMTAVSYIEAVLDHCCPGNESDYCTYYNRSNEFAPFYSTLPLFIQENISETFVNAFGFVREEVPLAFDSVVLGNGLPPHPIFASEPSVAHLPGSWNLDSFSFRTFRTDEEQSEEVLYYKPEGWAVLFDVTTDGLAFREGSSADARIGTRFSAAYYFDLGLFVSGGFEFITTFAEHTGIFNFDLAVEGGYYQTIIDHFGLEFFAKLNLGYSMSNGSVADDGTRIDEISSFDLGVGGGIRAMIRLTDEPVKSNLASLFIGVGYLWRLTAGHELLMSVGTLFNFM